MRANPGAGTLAAGDRRAHVAVTWRAIPASASRDSLVGGMLTWIKAISLICLVCWVVSWLIIGVKERIIAQGRWFDYLGVAGAILTPVCRHAQGARRCEANRAVQDRGLSR